MDGLTFTSELVKSLAWPAAALFIVVLLRNPLATLVPLLKKVKYGELEAEFGETVKELEKEAEKVLPISNAQAVEVKDTLVLGNPRMSVITSAMELEHMAREALKRKGVGLESNAAPDVLGISLALNKIVTPEQMHLFNALLKVGHRATFEMGPFDYQEAKAYVRAARRLMDYLSKVSKDEQK
ncbi:MAG: hypothetical protein JWN40_3391 [Phycisphaerales bacterium]|nr:hypothetical protein [Phycisphaerales bacterium]